MFDKEELNQFYRYCVALTGDETSAYDLLQNSLEKLVKKTQREKVNNLKAYFLRIIRNRFIDGLRKEQGRQMEKFDEEKTIVHIDVNYLEDNMVNTQQLNLILDTLSSLEREILFLWAVEGFTVQEIADHMKMPKGTVLSKLHRLKAKCQRNFGKKAQ